MTLFRQAEKRYFQGDLEHAEALLRQMAETRHANAASLLGALCRDTGRREEALHWYERAAERGDEEAAEEAARLHAASRE
jgi:TPR repeat protein